MSIEERLRERADVAKAEADYPPSRDVGATVGRGMVGGMLAAAGTDRYTVRNALKQEAAELERRARGLRALAEALPTSGLSPEVEAQMLEAVHSLTVGRR